MRDVIKATMSPVLSLLIIMLGTSFFNTFVSVRLSMDGWGNIITGLVYASYYFGMMVGAFYMEKVIHFTGHIRAFSMFASITAASIILQGFTATPLGWMFFRFVTGAACAGLFIVIESWLLLLSSANTRGTVLSLYMISLYSAQSAGQFILSTVDLQSNSSFSIAVFFCAISIIPVCLMRASAPSLSESEYINIFYILKKVPIGFWGNLIAGMIISSFYALGPVFARETGFSVLQISTIMALTIFGGMALQWPIGLVSDLIERRKVIVLVVLILFALSIVLFIFNPMPFPLLLILLFFYGGFSFTLYPISITYCCDFFSSAGITAITCAALIIYGIGCILGPILSPILMQFTKPSGVFLFTSFLTLFYALYILWKYNRTHRPPKDLHENYQALPGNTSPKVADLDPRSESEEE